MFVKKNLAILFVLAILVTTMAACGSATPSEPAAEASRGGDVSVENHDQSESGATDEPTAPIEGTVPSEEASSTPEDVPDESASTGSGNFADYWQGEDYFDIVAYLEDNGADKVWGTDGEGYSPIDSGIKNYMATFFNEDWEIMIMAEAGVSIEKVYVDPDGRVRRDPNYIVPCAPEDLGNTVRVNKEGSTMKEGVLVTMDSVLQYLFANPDAEDPLKESGLFYFNQPL